jgi:hypothetical protein
VTESRPLSGNPTIKQWADGTEGLIIERRLRLLLAITSGVQAKDRDAMGRR